MKLYRSWMVVAAVAALVGVACGENTATRPDTGAAGADSGETDEDAAGDGGGGDAKADSGGETAGGDTGGADAVDTKADGGDSGGGGTDDTGTVDGGTGGDVEADGEAGSSGDATTDAAVDSGGPDVPKATLPLPECALGNPANCLNPSKCPEFPLCVDGQTYANDCDAIVKLKAYDWPKGYSDKIIKGACPACAACAKMKTKCNIQVGSCQQCDGGTCTDSVKACKIDSDCAAAFEVCATLKTEVKVTVAQLCLTKCMELMKNTDGKDVVSNGACKSTCSQPEPTGGGCPMGVYQPLCASDGKSYASECAMKHCDLAGCFPLGATAKSDKCEPGVLTKECPGECFAEASKIKPEAANCPKDCNAVCGITPTGKGQSFRNACLATNAGAKVKDCTGISSTAADKCSAGELYQNKGCCPDVDYTNVKQVCASKQSGKPEVPDTWVTFRNQAEFKCLTAGDPLWVFQYPGPCICTCSNIEKPFCGEDGLTYTNKCQAECYNPKGIGGKDGPC